jgi:hypothetical protein
MTAGKYFNRGVIALDSPYIGHVVRETYDKIVVFGEGNDRYDIPKSEIQTNRALDSRRKSRFSYL